MKNDEVIWYNIPSYPELSVKRVWPQVKQNQTLLAYFPDLKPSQLPEKEFLYGVLCTLMPNSVRKLVADGIKKRAPVFKDDTDNLVEITKELKELLCNLYSMKSKRLILLTLYLKQLQKEEQIIFWRNRLHWVAIENLRRSLMLISLIY